MTHTACPSTSPFAAATPHTYSGIMRIPGRNNRITPLPLLIASFVPEGQLAEAGRRSIRHHVSAALHRDLKLPLCKCILTVAGQPITPGFALRRTGALWLLQARAHPSQPPYTLFPVSAPTIRWQETVAIHDHTALMLIGCDRKLPSSAMSSRELYDFLNPRIAHGWFHAARIIVQPPPERR